MFDQEFVNGIAFIGQTTIYYCLIRGYILYYLPTFLYFYTSVEV